MEEKRVSLYKFLYDNNFYISPQLANIIESVIKTRRKAFLLRGPAGTGKTQLTYLVARWLGAEYIFFQCTYGSSEDDLLYKYIPTESTRSGIKITLGPIPRALSMSKTQRVVLVLDEFDKTRPSADALLLDVLQNTRVSLYLDERETVVVGNPENLVIFLTSNEMREFSEPLLRRVITITLQPLPPEKVMELLTKRFSKEVALLLSQIYADTINAGLRKPATIQELYQLGEVLEFGTSLPLEDLLKMFIIKYEDDWKKYREYIASRKAYEIFKKHDKKGEEDVSKYYEPPENVDEVEVDEEEEEERNTANEILQKLSRFTVKFREVTVEPKKVEEGKVEVTLKIPDNDFEAYTEVIKKLKPMPTDDPAKFGKFEYVEDEISVIISREPLRIEEAIKIIDSNLSAEMYYEDIIYVEDVESLISEATKVKYYTRNKVFLESKDVGYEEKVLLERDGIAWRVRGYCKVDSMQYRSVDPILTRKIYRKFTSNSENVIKMLLSKELNDVYIDVTALKDHTFATDEIKADEIIRLLTNLRRSNVSDIVRVTIGKKNHNINVTIKDSNITIDLGYRLGRELRKILGNADEFLLSEVDRVIEALRGM